jgi:hypothetical protein
MTIPADSKAEMDVDLVFSKPVVEKLFEFAMMISDPRRRNKIAGSICFGNPRSLLMLEVALKEERDVLFGEMREQRIAVWKNQSDTAVLKFAESETSKLVDIVGAIAITNEIGRFVRK